MKEINCKRRRIFNPTLQKKNKFSKIKDLPRFYEEKKLKKKLKRRGKNRLTAISPKERPSFCHIFHASILAGEGFF
jgi:hypothetical protein